MTKTKQKIIINGRLYDAATGLPMAHAEKPVAQAEEIAALGVQNILVQNQPPLKKPGKPSIISDITPPAVRASAPPRPLSRQPAPHLKSKVQKSMTLRRSSLKKPISPRRPTAQRTRRNVERSPHVSRFAPVKVDNAPLKVTPEIDPELAAQAKILQNAHAARVKKQAQVHNKPVISSRAVKEHLLKQQLANAPDTLHEQVFQAGRMSPRARFASVATTSLALVFLGGYLTYINIPNLSIRVAAANAGIDAHLPRYQPGGYRIQGPITYADGQVNVKYKQNGGNQNYAITQKASDWDPAATLDNYVKPESGDDYRIHSSQGLTIYTYGNKAVWVNGGILHVIDGNAPLSGPQVERIAVSM